MTSAEVILKSHPTTAVHTIRRCTPEVGQKWDQFVNDHPAGTYCHAFAWSEVLERAYGLRSFYLRIERSDARWQGVFPVVVLPALLQRSARGTSVAFCNYGDVLVNAEISVDGMRSACLEYLANQGLRTVEVRGLGTRVNESGQSPEVSMMLDLPSEPTELWKAIGQKARNQIRKAQKLGLVARWGDDQVDILYRIYAANMGRLGTPVHARKFFDEIVRSFGKQCDILTVGRGNIAMGAMLVIRQHDIWADPFASTVFAYNDKNPSMLMYWEALRAASAAGARRFDFGRSKTGSGTFHFKRQWGAIPFVIENRTYVNGQALATSVLDTYRGSQARLASEAWKRLPAAVQLRLGPAIRRWMP